MKKEYKIVKGAHIENKKAQAYGEELVKIAKENKNRLKPEMVLDESRKKGSVLHDYFEWDDSLAGEKYRIEQARYLIRSIKITIEHGDEKYEVRSFISLMIQNGDVKPERKYIPSEVVFKDKVFRKQAIKEAMSEFIAIQMKYRDIKELAEIFSAIKEVQKKLNI